MIRIFSMPDCQCEHRTRSVRARKWLFVAGAVSSLCVFPLSLRAQATGSESSGSPSPIAIVPIEDANRDQAKIVGALQVTKGTTFILKNGTITSGNQTTNVILPHRGVLHVCAATSLTLSADTSLSSSESPGLMMAMDHGAIEASFAAGRNSDVLMTPDLRILIGGPGSVDLKVRLGEHGDTCVDNPGANAPYVVVSSVFEGGAYRVQPGQRVMFQHGSLQEVVDQEKEPCGCPASARPGTNDFPLDQSEGLAPLKIGHPQPHPAAADRAAAAPELNRGLVYPHDSTQPPVASTASAPPPAAAVAPPTTVVPHPQKKKNLFRRFGRFLKRIFGAES